MDAKKLIKILERTGYKNEDIDYSSPPPIVRSIASKPHAAKKHKVMKNKNSHKDYWGDWVRDVKKNVKIPPPAKPNNYPPKVSSEIENIFNDIDNKKIDPTYYDKDDGVSKEIDDLLAKRRKKLGKPEPKKERPIQIKPERESPFADPMDAEMQARGRKKLF